MVDVVQLRIAQQNRGAQTPMLRLLGRCRSRSESVPSLGTSVSEDYHPQSRPPTVCGTGGRRYLKSHAGRGNAKLSSDGDVLRVDTSLFGFCFVLSRPACETEPVRAEKNRHSRTATSTMLIVEDREREEVRSRPQRFLNAQDRRGQYTRFAYSYHFLLKAASHLRFFRNRRAALAQLRSVRLQHRVHRIVKNYLDQPRECPSA